MARAPIETPIKFKGYPSVKAGIVKWPMSVIRLDCENKQKLVDLAEKILSKWRKYTDKKAFVFAKTNDEPHNTITPIARRRLCKVRGANSQSLYELDLVLRNNITTEEHPLGVYHPHAELHHIKKENIGLIEVMGLAVLPSRLKNEMQLLATALCEDKNIVTDAVLAKHVDWVREIRPKYKTIDKKNVDSILQKEIGIVFSKVLEHAGVYKRNEEGKEAFLRFIKSVNK